MALPSDPTAVLLDPHPLWVDAVERVLDGIGIRTAAKTTVPEEGFTAVEEHHPDIFIAELASAGERLGGMACVQRVRETLPEIRVVILSVFEDPQSIQAALDAGAAAFVMKTAHPDDLATAIRQAFEPSLYLAGSKIGRRAILRSTTGDGTDLTRRELEILRLVAQGHSNGELAKMLWITEQTVKFHLSNIYRKLDVANRTEAGRWAQVHGLLEGAPPNPWSSPGLVPAGSQSS
jgi:DNA-binding NarL/FixJ family response regulator